MTTTIDMRPKVKKYNGNGRQILADVHFRIEIPAYVRALNDYSQESREAERAAVTAFDNEVVQLLLADGWTLRKENCGYGSCPEVKKGAQYLYCHPQDISGEVEEENIGRMETTFRNMQSCKYRCTDNYGDVVVTTSEEDERQLYLDTYSNTQVTEVFKEMATTKRKNLYKDKWSVKRSVAYRLAIANRRIDLNEIGTGFYRERKPLVDFVKEHYDTLLKVGLIKESTGRDDMPLCRWVNKVEQREIEKRNRKIVGA